MSEKSSTESQFLQEKDLTGKEKTTTTTKNLLFQTSHKSLFTSSTFKRCVNWPTQTILWTGNGSLENWPWWSTPWRMESPSSTTSSSGQVKYSVKQALTQFYHQFIWPSHPVLLPVHLAESPNSTTSSSGQVTQFYYHFIWPDKLWPVHVAR